MVNIRLKKRDNCDLWAFFIAIFMAVTIFSVCGRMIGGKYSICVSDFQTQYVPYIRLFLRKVLNGGNFYYSFSNSLGDEITAQYAFFSCFSPFTLVYAIISNDYIASNTVVVLKFGITAFFFYHYAKKVLKKSGIYVSVFSTMYVFCGYSIVSYINTQYMDGMYILPLLMICLYLFFEKNEKFGLTICYSYLFINCFYTGYLLGIFSAFIFIICLIIKMIISVGRKEWISFIISKIGGYVLCVCLAFGISAFIILPAARYILFNQAPDVPNYQGMKANVLDVIGSLFIGTYRNDSGNYPYYFCGTISVMLLPFFFSNKSVKKESKIITACVIVFLGLCSLVPVFYLLMHCMDAPDGIGYRFGYLVCFILVSIAVYIYEEYKSKSRNVILAATVLAGLYLLAFIYASNFFTVEIPGYSIIGFEINIIFIVLYSVLLIKKQSGKRIIDAVILLAVMFEVIINGCMTNINMPYYLFSQKAVYERYYNQEKQLIDSLPEDSAFYRIHEKNAISNITQLYGVNGLGSMFCTFENYNVRKSLQNLGYMSISRYLGDYGSTPATMMLLGQKYDLHTYGVVQDSELTDSYYNVNPYTLGLGFLVDGELSKLDLTSDIVNNNPFEKQNMLFSAMVGSDVRLYDLLPSSITMSYDGIDLYENGDAILFELGDNVAEGHIWFEAQDVVDGPAYAYFTQADSNMYINSPVIQSEGGDTGYMMQNSYLSCPHILKLGQNDSGKYVVDIVVLNTMNMTMGNLYNMFFYKCNMEELEAVYNSLSKSELSINTLKDGYLEGIIEADGDGKQLFLSIPYSKYWNAYVDGEMVAINPVLDDAFMTIDISEGQHDIKLEYNNPLFMYGLLITLIGIVGFIILVLIEKKSAPHSDIEIQCN